MMSTSDDLLFETATRLVARSLRLPVESILRRLDRSQSSFSPIVEDEFKVVSAILRGFMDGLKVAK